MLEGYLQQYGLAAILILIMAEYCGLPLPTELAYVAGSHLIEIKAVPYWALFALIMICHFAGSLFAYTLGSRASRFAKKSRFKSFQTKMERWYQRFGPITIVATQLIGHVRPWASYVAGFSRIPRRQFVIYSTIGSALLTYIMLAIADQLIFLWQNHPILRVGLVIIFAVVVFLAIVATIKAFFGEKK